MNYKQVYFRYFGYCSDDVILCEVCGAVSVDIHHIVPKGMGGSKTKDNIENLMAVCRDCHNKAHANILTKQQLMDIHEKLLK